MKKLSLLSVLLLVILAGCTSTEDAILESSVYTDMKYVKATTNDDEYFLHFKKGSKTYKFETSRATYSRMKNTPNNTTTLFDLIGDDDDVFGIAPSANRK